jgi:recombination protein U
MKHPGGVRNKKGNGASYGNRGMGLEEDINLTNEYYLLHDIAVIHKKPVPITISKVNYPSRLEAVIEKAYFKTPSTTDYNGIYKGKYIDFEAKETKSSSFPLSNIHNHQIKHLESIIDHGGIAFLIVRFTKESETFLLKADDLIMFIKEKTRKSIPKNYFLEKGFIIKESFTPRIDYLKIIDHIYFGG